MEAVEKTLFSMNNLEFPTENIEKKSYGGVGAEGVNSAIEWLSMVDYECIQVGLC